MSKKRKELKSPIDTMIVDLIMDHYNVQSLQGQKELLTGDEFMELVVIAEQRYYENQLTDVKVGMA